MNINKVIISGRLAKDPEIKTLSNDNKVANMFMISNRVWYNKDKEKQEASVGIELNAFGGQANFAEYLNKGDFLIVEGRLEERTWETDDGNKRKAYSINVSNIDSPSTKKKDSGDSDNQKPESNDTESSKEEYNDNDVPF